ncbi:hypothetical protein BH09PAT3_BH09PAT3_3430 [soil metagenome]
MRIFVESDSIALEKTSGIGNATSEILRSFDQMTEQDPSLKVTAIVPFGRKQYVQSKYSFKNVKIAVLPPGYKYINYALTRTSVPLWPDLWYGRGVYVFPNYKTWSVPFSQAVTFVHDLAHIRLPHTTHPKNLTYLNANFIRWLKRADVLATISKSSANDIAEFFPEYASKTKLAYLGVNTDFYKKQSSEEVSAVRKRWDLPDKYLLYVGSIEPRKNILTLLNVYQQYTDTYKTDNIGLVLIGGDGWKNEAIIKKLNQLKSAGYNIVHPEEYVDDADLPAIYSGATALVHPAIYEGFGLSILQAMACGLPVITGNNSSLPEVVGNAGIMVDVAQKDELCKAIRSVVSDKKYQHELQRKGLQRAYEFSWNNTCRAIMDSVK